MRPPSVLMKGRIKGPEEGGWQGWGTGPTLITAKEHEDNPASSHKQAGPGASETWQALWTGGRKPNKKWEWEGGELGRSPFTINVQSCS